MIPTIIGTIAGELIFPLVRDGIKKLAGWIFRKFIKKDKKIKPEDIEKELLNAINSGETDEFIEKYSEVLTQRQTEQINSLVTLKDSAESASYVINNRLYDDKSIEKLEEFRKTLTDTAADLQFDKSLSLKISDPDTKETVRIDDLNYALAFMNKLIGSAYTKNAHRLTPNMEGWAIGYAAKMEVELRVLPPEFLRYMDSRSRVVTIEGSDYSYLLNACKLIIETYKLGKRVSDTYNRAIEEFKSALFHVQNAVIKEEYSKLSKDYLKTLISGFRGEAKYWLLGANPDLLMELQTILNADEHSIQKAKLELGIVHEDELLFKEAILEYRNLKKGYTEALDFFSNAYDSCPEGEEKTIISKRKTKIAEFIEKLERFRG